MRSRSTVPAAIALAVLLLAVPGCLSGTTDEPAQTSDTPDALVTPAPLMEEQELYAFDDLVVGASAPHPNAPHGPAASQLPVAKVEKFTLPEGATNVTFAGQPEYGTGAARIDVHGPDGTVVWASVDQITAGAPGGPGAGLQGQSPYEGDGALPAGEYEVRYYVAGAFRMMLTVTAALPVAP